jgi:hypothetical protein
MSRLFPGFPRHFHVGIAAAVAIVVLGLSATAALGATRTVRYHGYKLVVPATWPVFHLQRDPSACVRFDRHAVYLGQPGANQNCPPQAAGRTEAILVQPMSAHAGAAGGPAGQVLPAPVTAAALPAQGSSAQLVRPAQAVVVTATWNHDAGAVRRALGVGSLPAPAAVARAAVAHTPRAGVSRMHAARASARAASVYTGVGFDVCSTPSTTKMADWGASPYRAIGVYIGGTNMACSQPNLSAAWTSQQTAAGWHFVPIYVGLQAPSNDCSCAGISSSSASSQGTAAAQDAVAHAQAIGLGAGNPIYFDMEGYDRTTSNTNAVMSFLAAWTSELHASGYASGVYSSADSGIGDLADRIGTGFAEPDDIWIARWNGAQNTSDPDVPSGDWASHQRLHQYAGDHNETYGGGTMDIDSDYLDGATASSGTVVTAPVPTIASAPSVSLSPQGNGNVNVRPNWSGMGVSGWQVLAGASPASLAPVSNPSRVGAGKSIVMRSSYNYFAVTAFGSGGVQLGSSAPVATPRHLAIFGNSAFVPPKGMGGIPVGCFSPVPCQVTTSIYLGKRRLARTGAERIGVGGGLAYFKLPPGLQIDLSRQSHGRLPVSVTVRDRSGISATRSLTLVPFRTSGSGAAPAARETGSLRLLGATEFVSNGRVGGLLAGCFASAPCHASISLTSQGKTIAHTKPELLGVNELGYLFFTLTNAGHNLLAKTQTNRLSTKVKVTIAAVSASPTSSSGPTTTTGGGSTGGSSAGGASPGATGVGVAPASSGGTVSTQLSLVSFH